MSAAELRAPRRAHSIYPFAVLNRQRSDSQASRVRHNMNIATTLSVSMPCSMQLALIAGSLLVFVLPGALAQATCTNVPDAAGLIRHVRSNAQDAYVCLSGNVDECAPAALSSVARTPACARVVCEMPLGAMCQARPRFSSLMVLGSNNPFRVAVVSVAGAWQRPTRCKPPQVKRAMRTAALAAAFLKHRNANAVI